MIEEIDDLKLFGHVAFDEPMTTATVCPRTMQSMKSVLYDEFSSRNGTDAQFSGPELGAARTRSLLSQDALSMAWFRVTGSKDQNVRS